MKVFTVAGLLRALGIAVLFIAWAWFAHQASAGEERSDLAVAVACAPLAAITILLWRVGEPRLMIAGSLAMFAVLAWYWPTLRQNVALLYYLQHVGANLALGVLFGRSLFTKGDALVTQFARLARHGRLSDAKFRYTRQVTVAWTIFFGVTAAVSTVLFLFAPAAVWSVFANLLAMPLLCLMFAVEYLVRRCVLPPSDFTGIAESIRSYRTSVRHRRSPANHR